jgi:exosortase
LFALGILWMRRETFPAGQSRAHWSGVLLVAAGAVMQVVGAFVYMRWLSGISLLAYVAGITVLVAGWPVLRWAAPAIAFLAFMVPLPYRLEVAMKYPLQRISTVASAYMLQTLGLPALAEGNVILLNEHELGVIDACSGLKMMIVFFALATAVALLSKRRLGERLLIVLSAVPIAILSNVARITVTGVMYEVAGPKWANLVFHDLAGWLMMPLALVILWGELALLSVLIIDDTPTAPALLLNRVERGGPPGAPPSKRVATSIRG